MTIGYAVARNIKVEKVSAELEEKKRGLIKEVQGRYGSKPILDVLEVKAYRDFFRIIGVDPTKVRPPIEYLIRKALSGSFSSINTLVDSCLLASLEHFAVVSVFDFDKTIGDLVVDVANGNERFELIDRRIVTLSEGEVLLRDGERILTSYIFGDARAAMVSPQTRNVIFVVWNAPGVDRSRVEAALSKTIEYVKELNQGTIEKKEVLG